MVLNKRKDVSTKDGGGDMNDVLNSKHPTKVVKLEKEHLTTRAIIKDVLGGERGSAPPKTF